MIIVMMVMVGMTRFGSRSMLWNTIQIWVHLSLTSRSLLVWRPCVPPYKITNKLADIFRANSCTQYIFSKSLSHTHSTHGTAYIFSKVFYVALNRNENSLQSRSSSLPYASVNESD